MALAALKVTALVLVLVAVNHFVGQVRDWLSVDIRPSNEHIVHRTVMLAALLYALALAVPFVPGVEIGLGLIAMLGVKIVPLVYLCTVCGLTLAYLAGRLVPPRALARLARDLRLRRASALLAEFDEVPPGAALPYLLSAAPNRLAAGLIRYRHAAVAVAINLPGNIVLGGGGGIALVCGMSRLFPPPVFVLTVLIAVAPVPLLVLLAGPAVLAH